MDSDKKQLKQHALSMFSSGIIQAVVGFISNLILIRFISPAEFGVFALVLANSTLLNAFFNFRIGDLILRSTEKELSNHLQEYSNFTFFQCLFNGLGGLVLLYLGGFINYQSILVLTAITITPLIQLQIYLFERKLKYFNIALVESGSHLLSHLFAVIGVFLGWGAIVLYLRILLQPCLLFLGLAYKKGLTKLEFKWVAPKEIKTVFSQGKWIWLDNLMEQSFERLIIIGANFFIPISAVGYFFQAKRLAVTPHQLLQPFTTRVLLNYFSRVDKKEQYRLLYKTILLEIIVLGFAIGFLFLFGKPVIIFLFGNLWAPVAEVVLGLCGVIGGLTIFNTFKAYYISTKNIPRLITWGRTPYFVCLVLSFVILYKYFPENTNLNNLAYAISIGFLTSIVFLFLSFRKQKLNQRNINNVGS